MSLVITVLTVALVTTGVAFYLAGSLGLLRFGDPLSRLHALTKADNLGLGLIVVALLLHADSVAVALKLILIWALALLAAATSAALLARSRRGSTS